MGGARIKGVRKRDGRLEPFDPARIEAAAAKAFAATGEAAEPAAAAAAVARTVVGKLEAEGAELPHIEQIQDLVERALMELGFCAAAKAYILYRDQRRQIREVKALVSQDLIDAYLDEADWRVRENANAGFSLQGLNNYLVGALAAEYWLERIYPPEVRDAHRSGDLHLHDLGLVAPYTYFGKEVVVAKRSGELLLTSLENLYKSAEGPEVLLDERDQAWAKHPKDLFVLDKDGWTRVLRLVRKKKHKPVRFVKNEGGRSVIVTEDHPMLVKKFEGGGEEILEVAASVVKPGEHAALTVDLAALLRNEDLFSEKEIFVAEELYRRGRRDFWLGGLPVEEYLSCSGASLRDDVEVSVAAAARGIRNRIELTEAFGYLIGFIVAEGYWNKHTIRLSQKKSGEAWEWILGMLKQGAAHAGCALLVRTQPDGDGLAKITISNATLVSLLSEVFNIRLLSRHVSLPEQVLRYSKDFVRGLLGAVIDGDGSYGVPDRRIITVRISSRTLLEQAAALLSLLGFTPRDRNCEGVGSRRVYKGREIVQNYPLYGIGFRVKDIDLPSHRYRAARRSRQAWRKEEPGWHKVLNNKETAIPDEWIYDVTTASGTLVMNGMWCHNCMGWDLRQLLEEGFNGVPGHTEASPPKHFRSALGQVYNFLYTLQGEAAGAQAFSSFDTYLAPFIRADGLGYEQVKQALQEAVFNLNTSTRVGGQCPFTNVTLDLRPPEFLAGEPAVVGGRDMPFAYGECQEEIGMFNRAFAEVLLAGDAGGRGFTFPIPTYNMTGDFPWGSPEAEAVFRLAARYGNPYFANFISSDMKPEDVRSLCCRLRLDNRELLKRGGGLFGANPQTGSVGVVTLNLARLGYLAKDEEDLFARLGRLAGIAVTALEVKRKALERFAEAGLYPFTSRYLAGVKRRFGRLFANHFSTIGVVGGNEMCLNLLGVGIAHPDSRRLAVKVLEFLREFCREAQQRTGNLYNLEATPAEGCSYRLAKVDKEKFPDIIVANEEAWRKGAAPYYTNSTMLPVDATDDIFEILDHQDDLQVLYTGGTTVHVWIGEESPDPGACAEFVRRVFENYRLPYLSLTPTYSVCPAHGYLSGRRDFCPRCGEECEVYSRVVGYYRPVKRWNAGKQAEFADRKTFSLSSWKG